ncbi:MAG: TetR/AcrR family transcriptional regulator [Bacilli bacterium]|nr:TetR/AcrR family transcriptional regulator [Mollicutes bacterium]MDY3899790.1 TetR/AcrR family transcriptional regulator [Bacilli bacterium]
MPAKKSITKQMILDTALKLLKERGIEAINARCIAESLNCSTQPLYASFKNMDDLKKELKTKCQETYHSYIEFGIKNETTVYMQYLMSYINFASENPHLFEYLYMQKITSDAEYDNTLNEIVINKIMEVSNISREKAESFFLSSWIFAHGIATQIVTGYVKWDQNTIRHFLMEEFKALRLYYVEAK